MCIECSGVHRQLGVHVSKVRSCTLDVKVWEPLVLQVCEAIGNQYSNTVWEAALPTAELPAGVEHLQQQQQQQQQRLKHTESWVWCDDDDDDDNDELDDSDESDTTEDDDTPKAAPAAAASARVPMGGSSRRRRQQQQKLGRRQVWDVGSACAASVSSCGPAVLLLLFLFFQWSRSAMITVPEAGASLSS
jgi:hypothetical protein